MTPATRDEGFFSKSVMILLRMASANRFIGEVAYGAGGGTGVGGAFSPGYSSSILRLHLFPG